MDCELVGWSCSRIFVSSDCTYRVMSNTNLCKINHHDMLACVVQKTCWHKAINQSLFRARYLQWSLVRSQRSQWLSSDRCTTASTAASS